MRVSPTRGSIGEGDEEGVQWNVEGGKDASGMGGCGRHGTSKHQQIIHQQLRNISLLM